MGEKTQHEGRMAKMPDFWAMFDTLHTVEKREIPTDHGGAGMI
jgi:hypothetical protein